MQGSSRQVRRPPAGKARAGAGKTNATPKPALVRRVVGRSVERRPLAAYIHAPEGQARTVIFGGFHGDEPKSVYLVRRLIELLLTGDVRLPAEGCVLVPVVNPDGYLRRRRRNARRVDVNRNFPTHNWVQTSPRRRMYGGESPASEPETRAVVALLERFQPTRVLTVHSIGEDQYCNNYDGPAKRLARMFQCYNGYPVSGSIGYPTPGSFGTWCGRERRIATLTLELPSHHSPQRCWRDNIAALLAFMGVRGPARA